MKNFLKITQSTFMLILIIIGFTSCEPETIIETREVEVLVYQPADSIFIQTSPFGTLTYTQIMQGNNVTLQPGLNHYAHVDVENYSGFEINIYFGAQSETWINRNIFQDGAVVIQTNETALDVDLDNDDVDLEGILNLGENQVSSFDIYINADLLSNSALTFPELRIRLEKEEYIGDEERLRKVYFNKEYVNSDNDEDLGLIALNDETPIELDIDIDIDVEILQGNPGFSKAELVIEIDQESNDNLFLDVNSFEFNINGTDYNIQNLPSNITISLDSDALQFPDAYLINNDNQEEIEMDIIAPIGTLIILKSYAWSGQNTNFSSLLHLNEIIQM